MLRYAGNFYIGIFFLACLVIPQEFRDPIEYDEYIACVVLFIPPPPPPFFSTPNIELNSHVELTWLATYKYSQIKMKVMKQDGQSEAATGLPYESPPPRAIYYKNETV